MNPNLDDPNNHVPPISAGDNWDDLDESTERSRVGLPPRRVERGLPPKKESLSEKVSVKTLMSGMVSDDEAPDDQAPRKGDDSEDAPPEESLARHEEIPIKPRRARARKEKREESLPEESEEAEEEPMEIAVVLPHPKASKRGRVNEINPGSDRPAARTAGVVAKIPSGGEEGDPKDILQKRRRFLRGERADWGGEGRRRSMRWMLLTGIGVAALVVVAVVLSQRGGKNARGEEQSVYSKLAPAEDDIPRDTKDAEIIDKLLGSRAEAESIFAAYASAKSPEDLTGLIHAPTLNRELIEKAWKPLGVEKGWKPSTDAVWYVKDGGGTRFAVLEGILADFTPFRAFFRQDEGGLKMDWKATSGYSSASFPELKSGRGEGGEVRAWLSQADFYTFSFPEGEYRSFRVMSPQADTTIWGYAPAGSDLEKEMLELFKPGQITGESQTEIQAILKLQPSAGDSLPNQWLITDIVRLDWLDG